jgi:hypothetical protein
MKHFEEYKPKEKGKSDFYSWNLYRWLKKQQKEGFFRKTNIYKTEDGALYIGARYGGWHDGVTGTKLRSLCSGSGTGKFPLVGLFCDSHKWEDITDWFWSEYERIGVCAIHGEFAHNFELVNDTTRKCNHCGKIEYKKIEMVERITWEYK